MNSSARKPNARQHVAHALHLKRAEPGAEVALIAFGATARRHPRNGPFAEGGGEGSISLVGQAEKLLEVVHRRISSLLGKQLLPLALGNELGHLGVRIIQITEEAGVAHACTHMGFSPRAIKFEHMVHFSTVFDTCCGASAKPTANSMAYFGSPSLYTRTS